MQNLFLNFRILLYIPIKKKHISFKEMRTKLSEIQLQNKHSQFVRKTKTPT